MTVDDTGANRLIVTRDLTEEIVSSLDVLAPKLTHLAELARQLREDLRASGYRTRPIQREIANQAGEIISGLCGQLEVAWGDAGLADERVRQLIDLTAYGPFLVPKERPDVRAALLAAGIEITETKRR